MLFKAILVGLVVWIAFLDKAFLSTFLYRPVFIGPLVGLIMGDLSTGLEVGVAVELMFLAMVFVGTAIPPDEVMSAAIATAFAIMAGGDVSVGIATAVPVAALGQMFRYIRMASFQQWTNIRMEKCIEKYDFKGIIRYCTIVPAIFNLLLFGLPTFLAVYFGDKLVLSIISAIPEVVIFGISVGGGLIGAVGVALLLMSIKNKNMWPFFLLGFFVVGYLHISMIGVAIVAVICVAISYYATQRTNNNLQNQ